MKIQLAKFKQSLRQKCKFHNLEKKWLGPYKLIRILNNSVLIKDVATGKTKYVYSDFVKHEFKIIRNGRQSNEPKQLAEDKTESPECQKIKKPYL